MNVELKALLSLVLDAVSIAQQAAAKKNVIVLIPGLFQLATDIAPAVANWGSLQSELKALAGSAQEADLVAFIEDKFGASSSAKAQAILSAVLKLIQDGAQDILALQSAIKS